MELEIQWIWLGQVKVCMCAIVRGNLKVDDFKNMLRRVGEAFISFSGLVVFDLRQASWELGSEDFPGVVAALVDARLGIDHKVALVSGRDIEQFGQLVYIASGLSNRGLKVRAFYDFDAAVKWLAEQWD
jgi:hypothetical protein